MAATEVASRSHSAIIEGGVAETVSPTRRQAHHRLALTTALVALRDSTRSTIAGLVGTIDMLRRSAPTAMPSCSRCAWPPFSPGIGPRSA